MLKVLKFSAPVDAEGVCDGDVVIVGVGVNVGVLDTVTVGVTVGVGVLLGVAAGVADIDGQGAWLVNGLPGPLWNQ